MILRKIFILLLFSLFLYGADAGSGYYDDSYLGNYLESKGVTSSQAQEFKETLLVLSFGVIAGICAYLPIFFLLTSTISSISNAPMNEHYDRVSQGEPLKFFSTSVIVVVVVFSCYTIFVGACDNIFFTSYAPMSGLLEKFWVITPPETVTGRYGSVTLSLMQTVVKARMIIELVAYFVLLVILAACFIFTFTYLSNFKTSKSLTSLFLSMVVALLVFFTVSFLFDRYASNVLNSSETVLSIGQRYLQTGLNYFMDGEL